MRYGEAFPRIHNHRGWGSGRNRAGNAWKGCFQGGIEDRRRRSIPRDEGDIAVEPGRAPKVIVPDFVAGAALILRRSIRILPVFDLRKGTLGR